MAVSISIGITQNSQNIANNTSNVTVKVTAKWTYGSYNLDAASTSGSYCTINGTKYSFTSAFNTGQTTSGSKVIFTKTLNIAHGSDGTKKLSVSASYNTDTSSGTVTDTASKTLTTIPRATEPIWNVSSVYLEESMNIIVSGASTKFTHDLTYKYTHDGTNYSGTIATQKGSGDVTWKVPKSIATKLTDATSVTVTITCKTYNGTGRTSDDLVGTKSDTITVKVPTTEDYYPKFTEVSFNDAKGYKEKYEAFVQGKSALSLVVNGSGGYGSKCKECKFVVEGVTYSAEISNNTNGTWTASKALSKTVQNYGTVPVKITVKDERGRTHTETIGFGVAAYSRPSINSLQAYRCKSLTDSSADDNGAYMCIVANTLVTPLGDKNGNTVLLQYRKSGDTDWKTATTGNVYSGITEAIVPADTELSYEVQAVVTDDFYTSERDTAVSSVLVMMDFHAEGKGMAIGKVAEDEYKDHLDIGLPIRMAESNFIDVMFTNEKGLVAENKSKFIKPLNLVVIDLRIQLPNVPYEADKQYTLLNLVDDSYAPTNVKALSAMQNIENGRIYQAAMLADGSLIMKLSYNITASSYISVQGCYFL